MRGCGQRGGLDWEARALIALGLGALQRNVGEPTMLAIIRDPLR